MDEQPLFRGKGAAVALALIAGLTVLSMVLTSSEGPTFDRADSPSSLSTAPNGTAVFARILEASGRDVLRARVPVTDVAPSRDATVIVTGAELDRSDSEVLEQHLVDGGRLMLIESTLSGASDRSLRLSSSHVSGVRTGSIELDVVFPAYNGVDEVLIEAPFLAMPFGNDLLPIVSAENSVVVGVRERGAGSLVVLSDVGLVSNDAIALGDNARLALLLAGAGEGPVVFLEYPHGFEPITGLAVLPLRWRWAAGLLVVAGLLWMVGRSRSFGRPDAGGRDLPPPRVEYVRAMANSLARTRDRDGAIAPLVGRLERLAPRRATSGSRVVEETMKLLQDSSVEPIDVERAHRRETDGDVLAMGRVVAALNARRYGGVDE